MRTSSIALPILAASLSFVMGCGVPGALGARWGDDAEKTGARIGAPCTKWHAWSGPGGFEVCENLDTAVSAYGAKAYLRFYRKGRRLEGLALRFDHARWPAVRAAALADLPLSTESAGSDAPYEVFPDDSLVRVEKDGGDGFTVVVAGPAFGNAYAGYVLGEGLGGLFRFR